MRPLWWMAGAALLSSLAIAAAPGVESDREVLLGMLAPLVGAAATWVLVVRTYAARPEALTPVMIAAFAGKLVFFGAYVTSVLKVLGVRPLPFVISFTTYFIGLHLVEALLLQRFFAGRTPTYVARVPPQADPPER
ncbi:MAG: hypothetical protein HYY76_07675 [Acidobacteria bacterium]|nr:hypothetical protein [Acidobacteriota bacterium]